MLVIDASALVELLLRTALGERVEERLAINGTSLSAPHLVDIEVAHALRGAVAGKRASATRAQQALDDLSELALTRHPHDRLLWRIWELRNNLSAYDAAYIALAEALQAPLVTRDRRLGGAPGHHARVEVIAADA